MDVLLVIDMQKALFSTPRFDSNGVIDRINTIAAKIRKDSGKVIFIQHNGTEEDGLLSQTKGWELVESLHVDSNDLIITKSTCDSFYNTNLLNILEKLQTKRLFITGCATDFCVDTTIRSAASKNLSITVIKDCHTTGNRPHLNAAEIIEHHNWIWENMIVPETEINVVPATVALE